MPKILFYIANITIYSVLWAEANSLETYLNARKLVLDNFAALTQEQQMTHEKQVAITANILFFQAQKARLLQEIEAARLAETSSTHAWQKEAARTKRKNKEHALSVMQKFEKNPPQYAIRCMSDIDASSTTGETSDFLNQIGEMYSKSGHSTDNLLLKDFKRIGALNRMLSPISIDVLSHRLPKTLPPRIPIQPKLSTLEAQSLDAFGINANRTVAPQKDLSYLFTAPKLQPKNTAMCAGYAIASDMESSLNGAALLQLHSVSPSYAYRAILAGERAEQPEKGLCTLINSKEDPLAGVSSISHALENLSRVPVCSTDDTNASRIKTTQFTVSDSKSFRIKNPSLDYVKALISSGVAPMAVIDSEKRTENEDWIYPKSGGGYQHIVNIVGYGADRDPDCLDQTEYLIIRDSLGKFPIHYRVNASDFLRQTTEFHKVTSVREHVLVRLNPFNAVGSEAAK